MRTILFETIKNKAKEYIDEQSQWHYPHPTKALFYALQGACFSDKPVKPRMLLKEYCLEAEKLIDNWDIRMVGKLIELFPVVPKWAIGRKFICDYNEKGDWVLVYE